MVILRLFSSVILMDSSGFDYPKVVPPNPLTKLVPNSSTCWVYGVYIYIDIELIRWGYQQTSQPDHGDLKK